ncbi:MAG TPA: DNA-directed RNA polymerase subunit beta' [Candidatus Latescibacteria bacterium]|nr:DNA-directed RNA polymerase subunit beta' [Candidatus Latescibacterota bacterium]HOS64682.1 DNA-directed RNA polymerase subunit beta' [Candidatus Latescibacterota bacterium]HPK73650.1 DNA-directed RNA polymerase subunit beta' [Candidatus Latescibacterota bacterium]
MPQQRKPLDFDSIKIQLASPETIRSWSYGEVLKPETINYRTYKPERDGLFCERIFGPTRDWECHCGKYKRIRYKGVICDRCGVEVTQAKVRRERMGHIELAVSVSHIWYFKSVPSRMSYLLAMTVRNLERVLYYESYVVLDPGNAPLEKGDLISEEQVIDLEERSFQFSAEMGAGAIKKMLADLNLDELSAELRETIRKETSAQRKSEALRRLGIVEAFRQSNNRPEWMILDVIPVLPPELRPLVPLEGGRFATSDLNDLYRRVINRNNRLKKLIEIKAPEVILRNEKRMLQEAVDALFDNGRRSRAVRGDANRALKSLGDLLKGKQGRFRQNLLGKRVDYSGRSVIVVGPELKLYECGLPKIMALELFKPFIIHELERRGLVQTVKSAKKKIEQGSTEVWDILEEVIKGHPVLLNRAPTLHRLGIQAFQPVLVEGKAIRIHPLVCKAFNADFDGDQMAVHVPLSFEAQIEASVLMLSANNLLLPSSGNPVTIPTQDMVLGCYYLTKRLPVREKNKRVGRFSSPRDAILAYDLGKYGIHDDVEVRVNGRFITTTIGRLLFNEILPPEIGFVDKLMGSKELTTLVREVFRKLGNTRTVEVLDQLKKTGHHYATKAGISIGIDDVVVPPEKDRLINDAMQQSELVQEQYEQGVITEGERYNKIVEIWSHTSQRISKVMYENFATVENGFNPIFMMADSKARGNQEQIRQLAGMRGLMAKPQKKITGGIGEIIESPITANFREGLSVLEYFISTHGARKGLADTALKTAEAGYLTRRMVDVAQDVVVSELDCGTILGLDITALKEGEDVMVKLSDRILGRVALDDVVDPHNGEVVVEMGREITESLAAEIEDRGIDTVRIRSALTCESRTGICAECYGRNLATGKLAEIGEAVGVIAAQSIGEPGTQLTLRTFHTGGTAMQTGEQSRIDAPRAGTIRFNNILLAAREDSKIVISRGNGEIEILDEHGDPRARREVPYSAVLFVEDGQHVDAGQTLYESDPYNNTILTDSDGIVRFSDLISDVTFREEMSEAHVERVVVEQRNNTLNPRIEIVSSEGEKQRSYNIPVGARLIVQDGQQVRAGDQLVKIPRERSRTRDITGGLPRVAELFEARRPKEPAVVTEIDGTVRFGNVVRGSREVIVTSDVGDERHYVIPYGKYILVREGDHIHAGERLSEGSANPHDILRILGPFRVQEYLLNEIQAVYRLAGVDINDKHIEIIVRQMLQKVRVVEPGDSNFLEGDLVDKFRFMDENERIEEAGGQPATFEPVLLGITRASLMTESFLSAASFQETTKVLTKAAVEGKTDYLRGLKENIVIGHVIPAGTGVRLHRNSTTEGGELEPLPERALDDEEEEAMLGTKVLDVG